MTGPILSLSVKNREHDFGEIENGKLTKTEPAKYVYNVGMICQTIIKIAL